MFLGFADMLAKGRHSACSLIGAPLDHRIRIGQKGILFRRGAQTCRFNIGSGGRAPGPFHENSGYLIRRLGGESYSPFWATSGLFGQNGVVGQSLLRAWPHTPWHEAFAALSLDVWHWQCRCRRRWYLRPAGWILAGWRWFLVLTMRADEWWRCSLTDAERERMEAEIAEFYEPDDYEPEPYL